MNVYFSFTIYDLFSNPVIVFICQFYELNMLRFYVLNINQFRLGCL